MRFARHFTRADVETLFSDDFRMPEGFLFGVSNAAFQVEGGFNGPGEPLNNWVAFERSGRVERSGEANRFWTEYPEEVELAKNMGCGGFRMSIEWARVQPGSSARPGVIPQFDEEALEAYSDMIAAIMGGGMEPVVTLHHFTHPFWLGTDAWLEPSCLELFRDYVEKAVSSINTLLVEKHSLRPVRYYITINEPNGLALITYLSKYMPHGKGGLRNALKALNHLIDGHCRAYDTIHAVYADKGWEDPMVTYNTMNISIYEGDKIVTDLLNARRNGITRNGLAAYIDNGREAWNAEVVKCPEVESVPKVNLRLEQAAAGLAKRFFTLDRFEVALNAIYSSGKPDKLDYLAVDFYDPFPRNLIRFPDFEDLREARFRFNAEHWEWVQNPGAMYHFLKAEMINAEGLSLLIAESGMSHRMHQGKVSARKDGATRDVFLQSYIYEAMRAVKDGVPLFGYFYWSMVDNYEWGSYEPRFGLFSMDRSRKPVKRMETDVWGTDAAAAYGDIISALKSGEPERIADAFTRDR